MPSSDCPPWCIHDPCDGDHGSRSEAVPTVYSIGDEDTVEPLTIIVRIEQYRVDDAEGLGPRVSLYDNDPDSTWGVDLTAPQARQLADALTRTADLLESS